MFFLGLEHLGKALSLSKFYVYLLRDAFSHFNSVAAVLTFQHKRELLPSLLN